MTFTLDGHRSLPIEVQALVTTSVLPTPRRAVNGVDPSRIAMLVAVLYRHSKLNLLSNDLYISTIAGGQAKEPGSDLAIVAALASAATSKPIARATCAIGEISLTGQCARYRVWNIAFARPHASASPRRSFRHCASRCMSRDFSWWSPTHCPTH